jgi:hypothetical protein
LASEGSIITVISVRDSRGLFPFFCSRDNIGQIREEQSIQNLVILS